MFWKGPPKNFQTLKILFLKHGSFLSSMPTKSTLCPKYNLWSIIPNFLLLTSILVLFVFLPAWTIISNTASHHLFFFPVMFIFTNLYFCIKQFSSFYPQTSDPSCTWSCICLPTTYTVYQKSSEFYSQASYFLPLYFPCGKFQFPMVTGKTGTLRGKQTQDLKAKNKW